MTLKTMTIRLHRTVLTRKNTLFFLHFVSLEEVYLVVKGNDANLGLIIFYVISML